MTRDPLKEVLQMSKGYGGRSYNLPLKHSDFFKDSKYDLEYLGLSFSQRLTCFFVFFALGGLSFFYSLMNIISVVFSPTKFVIPYAFSNITFFVMIGFVLGFKTYFRSLFSRERRNITMIFLLTTIVTLYSAFKVSSYFIHLAMVLLQVTSFIVFVVSFVPGGSQGIGTMIKMMMK
ncbi:Protein transport protein SFT2 [Dictyocoela muelleri]|nr:Protein transport protein SFT2 [Dictyocoela muelleri]